MMRSLCLALILGLVVVGAGTADDQGETEGQTFDHSIFDSLLKKHVTKGQVDSSGLLSERAKLATYLEALGKASLKGLGVPEKFAFWINAYNAFTFEGVLKNLPGDKKKWAKFSVRTSVKNFWKGTAYLVTGKRMTLDQIEHEVLRPVYKDARLHFAIVCASRGCPPLRSEAFVGSRLNDQLMDQMDKFMADRSKLQIDVAKKTIKINPIFKWFKKDFVAAAGSVPRFLSRAVEDKKVAAALKTDGWTVSYLDYDWGLNLKR